MVASELLTGEGYSCQIAADGKTAVAEATSGRFDLVLMDCQMPEMDGFEASRLIRQRELKGFLQGRRTRLPIIALTANALKGDRQRCLEAGMDDYLSKPLEPEKLLQMVRSLLPHWDSLAPQLDGIRKEIDECLAFMPQPSAQPSDALTTNKN